MMNVDLSPLVSNDIEYVKLAADVEERFGCDWDDDVHESYRVFVRQVQERSHAIHFIRCKAEELAKEAEELKVDDLVSKAGDLCKEAEAV